MYVRLKSLDIWIHGHMVDKNISYFECILKMYVCLKLLDIGYIDDKVMPNFEK